MRCLWLTLADPHPPHNGQFIYSAGLIKALADAGAEMVVVGRRTPQSPRRDGEREGRIIWHFADHQLLSPWSSIASLLPNIVKRCRTRAMRRLVEEQLERDGWDVVAFDGLSVGWTLPAVLRRYPNRRQRPKLVYISHNHEESLRARMADNQPNWAMRAFQQWDAVKVRWLERTLVGAVDLVTAITGEDRDLYRADWPDKRIEVLMPGYQGQAVERRNITQDTPRRAVIVGSFDWVAKRMNLEEFVNVADPVFAERGVELQVIGSGKEAFFDQIKKRVAATSFTGTVDSASPYLRQARVAIVPERNGGGFKLKVLEYVFNRMPILALEGSVAGVPLCQDESILLFADQEALAKGVLGAIDDCERLNRLQDAAFNACCDKFDWANRGSQLMTAITSL
jgi:glycosyltransferase involved in cell wall biosynthesis